MASATPVCPITGHAFIRSYTASFHPRCLASLHIAQVAGLTLRQSATSFNPALGSLALEPPTLPQSHPTSPYPHYLEPRKAAKQRSSSPRTPRPAFSVIPTFLSCLRTITSHTQLSPSCLLPSHVHSHRLLVTRLMRYINQIFFF